MPSGLWRFAIDVGGTFCDCVALDPSGQLHTHKQLSSGRTKGVVDRADRERAFVSGEREGDPGDFWIGYEITFFEVARVELQTTRITGFDANTGRLLTEEPLDERVGVGTPYELFCGEPAPVLAIRRLLGLRLDESIPACSVRLGTTRATNALLERSGAPTGLLITEGFGDLLHIGDQSRPELFKLNIKKPLPLPRWSYEVRERVLADGCVERPLDVEHARRQLELLRADGAESVAISLLNAYRSPVHERLLADIARGVGFDHVSVSSDVANVQGFLSRTETCSVDAFVGPVFRSYLRDIGERIAGSSFRVMTGGGGLKSADDFNGPESVLSGPAGGLIGAVDVARRHGLERVITFDMGGTSTDVSRYDGDVEYEHETRKAGVRINMPVMAIETVAAGGGSVCTFDGYAFQVGPASSGTDPGPCCYGRGGPLSMTDVNLHLGRISETDFPFALEHTAVSERLQTLTAKIRRTGQVMATHEVAEGFVRVADAHMAAAIKRITIERGIDPRAFAMVSFGGAGGQHACGVADLLGITEILVPRHAGVLSAWGIGVADVRRWSQRPVHRVWNDACGAACDVAFAEMERQLRLELDREGVGAAVSFHRMLDVRYVGEGATLTVGFEDVASAFEVAHRRRFGYVHAGRAMEVTAIRVEAVGETEKPTVARLERSGSDRGRNASRVFVDGTWREATLLRDDVLATGDEVEGPAIVASATATTFVAPGWSVTATEFGDLMMKRTADGATASIRTVADADEPDPVTLELFNNHFAAVAEQMGTVLRQTALSTNVKERLDYSCAVFDADGSLVANAPHIPVHLGSMGACVRAVMEQMADLADGDVVVTNDPFGGGTHLPDVTVVTPVFVDGVLAFFVASRAHHAEIGGRWPGSMPPDSTRLDEEGVLIRAIKIAEGGAVRLDRLADVLKAGTYPSRSVAENLADVAAQMAANVMGVEALRGLVGMHGLDVVKAYMGHVRAAASGKMRAAIGRLADGERSFVDRLDDGREIRVRVVLDGESAVVNFSGTSGVHDGNFNATPAIVDSAVLYCFRCLIDEGIPLNAGVLEPIEIVLPEGMLRPPVDGVLPAVAAGNVETSQRIVDAVFGALGMVAASQGTMNNLTFGNERFGYYETICGGAGAGEGFDGADAVHTHMTNTRMTDVEVMEDRYPVRVRRFAVRRGSGGVGRHRGGDGCVRELEFAEPVTLSLITQRRVERPYGVDGGAAGAAGANRLVRADGVDEVLPSVVRVSVSVGDRVIIETPGGGGFGPTPET